MLKKINYPDKPELEVGDKIDWMLPEMLHRAPEYEDYLCLSDYCDWYGIDQEEIEEKDYVGRVSALCEWMDECYYQDTDYDEDFGYAYFVKDADELPFAKREILNDGFVKYSWNGQSITKKED